MFKRRQPELGGQSPGQETETSSAGAKAPSRGSGDAAPGRIQARRPAEPLASNARRPEPRERGGAPGASAASGENEGRKLVVGQGIRLSGEIKKCEKLVVEGEVQANLKDCLTLEIAETGLFNGAAVVDEAEISGCFEGELTAKTRLYVRSTGRILGTIRYADLEIERGGRIAGTVDVTEIEEAEAPEAEEASEPDDLGLESRALDSEGPADDSPPVEAEAEGYEPSRRPNGANGSGGGQDRPGGSPA